MSTPTTSFAAIRDALVLTIRGLTPARHSGQALQWAPRAGAEYRAVGRFRDWAELHPDLAFRMFDVRQLGWVLLGAQDQLIQRRESTVEIVVCYPNQYALYGSDNSGEQDDVMEEDSSAIVAAVGIFGAAAWPAGSTPKGVDPVEYEDAADVRYVSLLVTCEYYFQAVMT